MLKKMIGIDIIEVKRFEKFNEKLFTDREREYIRNSANSAQSSSGIFSAKEAVVKALKGNLKNIVEVEILHEVGGAPYAVVSGGLKTKLGNKKIELSISHSDSTAVAVAIIIK